MLDPLGEFNELQTLVRGVLAPQYLLDYLRYFVLFEDDGTLVKKIAVYQAPCGFRSHGAFCLLCHPFVMALYAMVLFAWGMLLLRSLAASAGRHAGSFGLV
ncbi:MAG: hypothetical protein ACRECD_00680 [Burkholderiaceae bacterium]